ncbi:MAG: PAS domain S-box protein, partial [Rubrivivax sp.]
MSDDFLPSLSAPEEGVVPADHGDSALNGARTRLAEAYLLAVAVVSAAAPMLVMVMPPPTPRAALTAVTLAVAALAGGAWAAVRQRRRAAAQGRRELHDGGPGPSPAATTPATSEADERRVAASVIGVALASSAGLATAAWWNGAGPTSPLLGFIALHAALAATLAGRAAGWAVGAFGVGAVALLAAAGGGDDGIRIAFAAAQAVLIGSGVGAGTLLARALRHAAQGAVRREQDFRGLLKITADAYWELDPSYQLVALSRERAGGVSADPSLLGVVPWQLPNFSCEPDVLDQLQADLGAHQRFRDLPVSWRGASGTRHFMVSGEPRRDARGVFRGYWGVARDVTDEWQARQALAQTESRYQDLFDRLPTPLVLHRDGRVLDANPAALVLFGFDDFGGMFDIDFAACFAHGESRERLRECTAQASTLPPGEALPVAEFHLVGRGARRAVVRATGVSVQTDGEPAVLSIFVDDTERQATEQVVRRSEALLSHLVASSPDLITLSELESGRYTMVNRAFEQTMGWPADEVVGRSSFDLGHWVDAAEREAFVRQVRKQRRVQDVPLRFRRRDGSVLPMMVSAAHFDMDGRDYLVINARDMSQSERDRLEREAILESASIGIALMRGQRFQVVNPALEQMLGWPTGSLVGESAAVAWPSADAWADLGAQIGPALDRGEQVEVECEVRRRDDSRFVCRLLARAIDPRYPGRGGTIWIVEDVTERRRVAEALARARDDAEAANRAKSAFLANTSHELRTPLNALLGLAQLARAPDLDGMRRTQYLQQITENSQALALIVSDILDLSKIEAGKLTIECEPFDLAALLGAVCRGVAESAELRGLALQLDVDPSIGWVRGDALRVRQILINYLGNAIKFTAEGSVRLFAHRSDSDSGGSVRLEVQDTGPGIDATTRARLFQRFSQADPSTTRRYGGTGLGLSICRELAERMGGAVGVDSRPGAGSRFWVCLPLPPEAPRRAADDEPLCRDVTRDGARVLVVDDNPVNEMIAKAQLEQLGLQVHSVRDGVAALAAVATAEAAGQLYDLVLMDLQMPQL